MKNDALRSCTLDELVIDDEATFSSLPLYGALKGALQDAGHTFLVLPAGKTPRWDRALFLNLTFWGGGRDVLCDHRISADVVTHVAWHHLAARHFAKDGALSTAALFAGEAIASAFDAYLVGALLRAGAASTFLETQVPAMAQTAEEAGLSSKAFARLLSSMADDPVRAFEDLRQLLVDVTAALYDCGGPEDGHAVLLRFSRHRFAPLLHRFELSNWVLWARAFRRGGVDEVNDVDVSAFDAALRKADDALQLLTTAWLP